MVWTWKGTTARRWREIGSRISAMTSGTETNLSAQWARVSPPWMIALASTTATAMPLEDLQLSTKTLPAAIEASEAEFWGFGSGCFLTMLLQQETGAGVGFGSGIGDAVTVASMVCGERDEFAKTLQR